ncbi:hypothetical protein [Streptomyces sp. NPDC056144]|uniref:hypothetical protein n=1 Tax=unclassified Streptomyces TaxID=2593676 RepID=UPI0035D556DB
MTAEHPRPGSRITDALLPPAHRPQQPPTPPTTPPRPGTAPAPEPARPAPPLPGTAPMASGTPALPGPQAVRPAVPSSGAVGPASSARPPVARPAGVGASALRGAGSAGGPEAGGARAVTPPFAGDGGRAAAGSGAEPGAAETTAQLRVIRAPSGAPGIARPAAEGFAPPASGRERRTARTFAVTACVVLGVGLIGGALAGMWLTSAEPEKPAEPPGYTEAMDLWHNAPVDTLFPRTLAGPDAGPGASGRTWTRIVVAPDAPCAPAALAPGLRAAVTPLGCERVLRATYTDATASSVITVGIVFTRADAATQATLGAGLTGRLGADVPPALAGPGTVAARFGAGQRASWWLNAPADLPVVVTAVSGFADGRVVDRPQPADRAMAAGRTDAVAQSGLGHEARGITERLAALLRKTATAAAKEKETAR